MSGGLFALLDDVAVLARLAAASVDDIGAAAGRATAKAAGVVIDDTAVTPQYVHGIAAERELPIIKRIAIGSLRNKIVFILPAIMMGTMFLQIKLNPTPPDPMQARIMMLMPLIFGGMMFFFPAGLVLYWCVNNTISIAQQRYIMHKLEKQKVQAQR